jgi:hypothetical protein
MTTTVENAPASAAQSRKWVAPKSVKSLKWEHRYVAIYKFSGKGQKLAEIKIATGEEIGRNEGLTRVLDALQRDLIHKRIYRFASNPTSYFFGFRQYGKGKANDGQTLLNELARAKTKAEVHAGALALADRYGKTAGVQKGVLIFLVTEGVLGPETQRPVVFVFKCDFEDVSQITAGEVFHKVQDAIVEKTKKGAMYPYFDRGRFDDTTVRVFDERGETRYWLDFLDLGELPSAYVPLHEATIQAWTSSHPELAGYYEAEMRAARPVRPLVGADRPVEEEALLPVAETQALIEAISERAGEQEVTLHLDNVRVTAPLKEFGHKWVFAEEGGQCYILIKGGKLTNNTKAFNPIDLAEVVGLGKAAELLLLTLDGRGEEE